MNPLFRALLAATFALAAAGAQQAPPPRLDFSQDTTVRRTPADTVTDTATEFATETSREMRTKFVRSQMILGLVAYGPSFAVMVGDDGVTGTAGYLVMAGGTFFAATEISRQLVITPARQFLSSRMAWRGSINGLTFGNTVDLRYRSIAGLTWLGGIGGTAAGLVLARDLSEGEAVAMVVGHDIAYLSSVALGYIVDPTNDDGTGLSSQARNISSMIIGWGGYVVGQRYARTADYEVTSGDAMLLWLGAGIGASTLGTFIAEGSPSTQAVSATILVGALAGIWTADRLLVRQFDHSSAEGSLVALGGGAGALMGIGLGVLFAGEAQRGASLTLGLAAAGGIGGIMLTERYAQPRADAGRQFDVGRVEFNPFGVVAAASRVPGRHPILRITF